MDLREARLHGANISQARLAGADLREARLEGADLTWARLDGVDLREARLEGADMGRARLEGANLGWARLEGANLIWARLEGATLFEARLEEANLLGARLEGAYLREARLQGAELSYAGLQSADWADATIGPSPAHSADFADGRNLTQSQLDLVIGDERTILPRDAETGEPLHVWSCWAEEAAARFIEIWAGRYPWWSRPEEMRQDLIERGWICGPDNLRRPVTPAAADAEGDDQ